MKYLILVISILFTTISFSQTLSYSDDIIDHDDQKIEAITATLEPNVSTIKNKFEDWMNDNYNVDLDGKKLLFFNKDVMSADDVMVPGVSRHKIQLNVKVDETNSGKTKLHVFARNKDGSYITESNDSIAHRGLNNIVKEFVADYLPEYYKEEIEDTEDEIQGLVDDKGNMEKQIKKNNEEIVNLQNENEELRQKIVEAESDISETKEVLEEKNLELDNISKKIKKDKKQ